jgi:hypothetical protein
LEYRYYATSGLPVYVRLNVAALVSLLLYQKKDPKNLILLGDPCPATNFAIASDFGFQTTQAI